MKREKEFHAIKLHSLESHGQSFFQIIIQIYFLFLLLILGTGTVIAGVSAEKFFQDICKLYYLSFMCGKKIKDGIIFEGIMEIPRDV